MANKQINELVELSTPSGSDLIAIYDFAEAGSEKTKKITRDNFMQYEEGTWTPVIADATSAGNVGTATTIAGSYVKIDKKITVCIRLNGIDTTGMTGGNVLYIRDLPFNADVTTNRYAAGIYTDNVTFTGYVSALCSNTNAVRLVDHATGSSASNMIVSDYSSGLANIILTMTYFTD